MCKLHQISDDSAFNIIVWEDESSAQASEVHPVNWKLIQYWEEKLWQRLLKVEHSHAFYDGIQSKVQTLVRLPIYDYVADSALLFSPNFVTNSLP